MHAAVGRKGSWDGAPSELASIIGTHLSSPSALVYGDNPQTAKVEPERALKFTLMWRELQQMCPNLSFKKKDLRAGDHILILNSLKACGIHPKLFVIILVCIAS
jgi:hypothetical protein